MSISWHVPQQMLFRGLGARVGGWHMKFISSPARLPPCAARRALLFAPLDRCQQNRAPLLVAKKFKLKRGFHAFGLLATSHSIVRGDGPRVWLALSVLVPVCPTDHPAVRCGRGHGQSGAKSALFSQRSFHWFTGFAQLLLLGLTRASGRQAIHTGPHQGAFTWTRSCSPIP